jgi:hypothetical protein
MGFRFRRRLRVVPGVYLNISKSGFSTSIGRRGATLNLSKRGARTTVGIPGTGVSYQSRREPWSQADAEAGQGPSPLAVVIVAVALIGALVAVLQAA